MKKYAVLPALLASALLVACNGKDGNDGVIPPDPNSDFPDGAFRITSSGPTGNFVNSVLIMQGSDIRFNQYVQATDEFANECYLPNLTGMIDDSGVVTGPATALATQADFTGTYAGGTLFADLTTIDTNSNPTPGFIQADLINKDPSAIEFVIDSNICSLTPVGTYTTANANGLQLTFDDGFVVASRTEVFDSLTMCRDTTGSGVINGNEFTLNGVDYEIEEDFDQPNMVSLTVVNKSTGNVAFNLSKDTLAEDEELAMLNDCPADNMPSPTVLVIEAPAEMSGLVAGDDYGVEVVFNGVVVESDAFTIDQMGRFVIEDVELNEDTVYTAMIRFVDLRTDQELTLAEGTAQVGGEVIGPVTMLTAGVEFDTDFDFDSDGATNVTEINSQANLAAAQAAVVVALDVLASANTELALVQQEVAIVEGEVDEAQTDVDDATAAKDDAQVTLDAATPVLADALTAQADAETALADAEADLAAAETALLNVSVDATSLTTAENDLANAQDLVVDAEADLDTAQTTLVDAESNLAAAEDILVDAEAALVDADQLIIDTAAAEATATVNLAAADAAVATATVADAQAATDLADAQADLDADPANPALIAARDAAAANKVTTAADLDAATVAAQVAVQVEVDAIAASTQAVADAATALVDRDAAQADVTVAEADVATAEADVLAKLSAVDAAEAALVPLEAAVASEQSLFDAALAAETASLQADVDAATQVVVDAQADVDASVAAVATAQADVDDAQIELDASMAVLADAQAALDAANAELTDVQAVEADVQADVGIAQANLNSANQEASEAEAAATDPLTP